MQFCPRTGMMHRYDKVTHRCVCGRWQRGFKPKTEPVNPKAECQVCERNQALTDKGCLVHHGYKRPGWGHIEGDCPGVGHLPYPATDALEAYVKMLRSELTKFRKLISQLPEIDELPYEWSIGSGANRRSGTHIVKKGDEHYAPVPGVFIPGFFQLIQNRKRSLENQLGFLKLELRRTTIRINKALNKETESCVPKKD